MMTIFSYLNLLILKMNSYNAESDLSGQYLNTLVHFDENKFDLDEYENKLKSFELYLKQRENN
jgi:hypothetical protein